MSVHEAPGLRWGKLLNRVELLSGVVPFEIAAFEDLAKALHFGEVGEHLLVCSSPKDGQPTYPDWLGFFVWNHWADEAVSVLEIAKVQAIARVRLSCGKGRDRASRMEVAQRIFGSIGVAPKPEHLALVDLRLCGVLAHDSGTWTDRGNRDRSA